MEDLTLWTLIQTFKSYSCTGPTPHLVDENLYRCFCHETTIYDSVETTATRRQSANTYWTSRQMTHSSSYPTPNPPLLNLSLQRHPISWVSPSSCYFKFNLSKNCKTIYFPLLIVSSINCTTICLISSQSWKFSSYTWLSHI